MRRFRLLTAAIAALCVTELQAANYSNAIFFGDSLSDAGTYNGQPALGGFFDIAGKFTTNPGPVWAEIVASELGYPTAPANQGGTDYAAGGARVDAQPGYPNSPLVPFIQTATPVREQINAYFASTGGRADANALYSVWAGANDVFALQDGGAGYGALPMAQVADQLTAQIARLNDAGARHIVVFNLPDIGITPSSIDAGAAAQAQATQLVQTYNHELFTQLSAQGIHVIPIDTFGLLHQVSNDAAKFGITNTTGRACGNLPTSLICDSGDYTAGAEHNYLFADGVHPTTGTYKILADYVLSVLVAPQQIAMLADSAIAAQSAWHELLLAQLIGGEDARKTSGRNIWLSVQGRTLDRSDSQIDPGTDSDAYQFAVGADFQIDPQWVVGAALGVEKNNVDYTQDRGDYSQRGITLSTYSNWQRDAWFARGALSYGDLNYSIDRRVPLGSFAYTADGDTDGRDLSAQFEGGYEFPLGRFITGPVFGVLAQDLRVDSFEEKNAGVINLGYGEQRRHTLVGSAGWQFAYRATGFHPYARVAVDRDFEDNEHSVEVSALSIPEALPFSMPAEGPGRTRYVAQLGCSGELFGGANFNVGVTQHFAQDDQRDLQAFGGVMLSF